MQIAFLNAFTNITIHIICSIRIKVYPLRITGQKSLFILRFLAGKERTNQLSMHKNYCKFIVHKRKILDCNLVKEQNRCSSVDNNAA